MNGFKKQLIKSFIKVSVIENSPGILRVRIANLNKQQEILEQYEVYLKRAIMLLQGISEVVIDYPKSTISIEYDSQQVKPQSIYRWLHIIIDVTIENIEFIQKYWQLDKALVENRIEEILRARLKLSKLQ